MASQPPILRKTGAAPVGARQGHGRVLSLFRHGGRADWLVLLPFTAITTLVVLNAVWHHPKIGYDVVDNLTYIQVLWHRLPKSTDTGEFFSPPLPFILPSLFDRSCVASHAAELDRFDGFYTSWACRTFDGKFAQALNVLLSVGSTLILLEICERLRPQNRFFKFSALVVLANLTVYYKTFSQVRSEPYVVFFATLTILLVFGILGATTFRWRTPSLAGFSLGCLILSRQWGFFMYPALGLVALPIYFHDHQRGWLVARQFLVTIAISLLVGGFFYVHLYRDYGSASAFNITRPVYPSVEDAFSLLRPTYLGGLELFREPVRPKFTGSVLPVLYSETWGDYWGYFTFIKPNSSFGINGYETSSAFISYLGRVNLVSVPTAVLLLAAVGFSLVEILRYAFGGRAQEPHEAFVYLVMLCMLGGFLWFIYSYVLASDRVLKTTYVLQGLVVLVIPAAALLEKLRAKWHLAYFMIMGLLAAILVHDFPAMVTHYSVFYFW
jgi:hypothetical protein